jgi:hypothetical protein
MSELAVTGNPSTEVEATPQKPTETAMEQWAREARVVAQIAASISTTSFAGQLRGKPDEVTAVILAGNELGLPPMAALKAIDIIGGTPALRAHAMRGLIQSKGHEIELVESSPEHCLMRGRRKGAEAWQHVEWPIARAAKLGLTDKPEWKKQPQTMLVARATGELCRLIAADALHAMPYAAEELEGVAHAEIVTERPRLSIDDLTA